MGDVSFACLVLSCLLHLMMESNCNRAREFSMYFLVIVQVFTSRICHNLSKCAIYLVFFSSLSLIQKSLVFFLYRSLDVNMVECGRGQRVAFSFGSESKYSNALELNY